MLEKSLHTGNIAAAFGSLETTAEDLTVFGGTAPAIGGILSGLAIFKKDPATQAIAKQMGTAFEAAVKASPLSDGRKKLIPQIMQKYPVTEGDIASGNLVAAQVATIVRARIENAHEADPALRNAAVLDAYASILTQTLDPVLIAPADLDPTQTAILRELLLRSDQSGDADKMRDEGITEKAIIRLAQRIAEDTGDVGQAWLELQNAMDMAVRVQAEGQVKSNHGDFVDTVLERVAELARDGDYETAVAEIDAALEKADAEKVRLLESGVEVALLDRDTAKAAQLLVRKADVEAGGIAEFGALRALWTLYYEIGRDRGSNLDSALAIELAKLSQSRATDADQRSAAGNDLGVALQTLGEREAGTKRLDHAVAAYTEALKENTRDRVPMQWAKSQHCLAGVEIDFLSKRTTKRGSTRPMPMRRPRGRFMLRRGRITTPTGLTNSILPRLKSGAALLAIRY